MKKICCLLLTLILSVSTFFSSACAESDSSTIFEPLLLTVMDTSASEWYKSSNNRSMFAAVATLDIIHEFGEQYNAQTTYALANDTIYVAKDGLRLALFFHSDDGCLMFGYQPLSDTAGVVLTEESITSSVMIEYILDSMVESEAIDSYYQVDAEAAVELMLEIISSLSE